jgi:hypothetical protein
MPNNACMSESTDACREDEGDSAEICMQQAYNYLHSTHIFPRFWMACPEFGEDPKVALKMANAPSFLESIGLHSQA